LNPLFCIASSGLDFISPLTWGFLTIRKLLGLLELLHQLLLHLLFIYHEQRDASSSTAIPLVILGISELISSLEVGLSSFSALVCLFLFGVENRVNRHESSVLSERVRDCHSLALFSSLDRLNFLS